MKPREQWGRLAGVIIIAIFTVILEPTPGRSQTTPLPEVTPDTSARVDELSQQAIQAFRARNFRTSERLWREILNLSPNLPEHHVGLGNALRLQHRYPESISAYQKAIELNSQYVDAYLGLAAAFNDQRQWSEAIANYSRAIEINPQFADAYIGLILVHKSQKNYEAAIHIYEDAARQNIESADLYHAVAQVYFDQKKWSEAGDFYRRAIQTNPKSTDSYIGLMDALKRHRMFDEIPEIYQESQRQGITNPGIYQIFGSVLSEEQKWAEAAEIYQKAVNSNPKYIDAYEGLGNALRRQGKFEEAIFWYQRGINLNTGNEKIYLLYHGIGTVFMLQEKYSEAVRAYREAINREPASKPNLILNSYYSLGDALRFNNQLDDAIQIYRKVVDRLPNQPAPLTSLGYAFEQKGELESAITYYELALQLDPNYAWARNSLRSAREELAARRNPPVLDDLPFVPSKEQNPKVDLFRATVIVEARFGATGQDAGSLNWGAGWVLKREGNTLWIVTCRHNVIDKLDRLGTELTIQFYNLLPAGQTRRKFTTVELLQQDATLDLAVLKVTGTPTDIKPLVMADPQKIALIGPVWTIGHPYPIDEDPWLLTNGERGNYNDQQQKFPITATIASGSSGGPVFDEQNQLIGMVAEVVDDSSSSPNPWEVTPEGAQVRGQLGRAIRIQLIREKLQTWGILP